MRETHSLLLVIVALAVVLLRVEISLRGISANSLVGETMRNEPNPSITSIFIGIF
jgi:hypothetical protein